MAEVKQGRVLVVEDNEVNQVLAVAILAKLGHRADVAGDGRQGVELVLHGDYEAVLMDCQMPVLDGYQATAEIRRREGTARHTPIIAMTAAVLQDGQTCLAAGMSVTWKPVAKMMVSTSRSVPSALTIERSRPASS